jgi:hypothetical protein
LRWALSKGHNRVGVSPHLRTETDQVSETSCFSFLFFSYQLESGQWTKSENSVILCVIHHRQNPIEPAVMNCLVSIMGKTCSLEILCLHKLEIWIGKVTDYELNNFVSIPDEGSIFSFATAMFRPTLCHWISYHRMHRSFSRRCKGSCLLHCISLIRLPEIFLTIVGNFMFYVSFRKQRRAAYCRSRLSVSFCLCLPQYQHLAGHFPS